MNPIRAARWKLTALGALLLVASFEVVRGCQIQQTTPREGDWLELQRTLDESPWPVVAAQLWLDPELRRVIDSAAKPLHWARADIQDWSDFWVVSHIDAPSWSEELEADLEGYPRPTLQSERDFGALRLTHYHNPHAFVRLSDLDDLDVPNIKVYADGQRCRQARGRNSFRCNKAIDVELKLAEIDYRPRYCLRTRARDGVATQFEFNWAKLPRETPLTLRGHLGFHDYNARLRNDGALRVDVYADGDARQHAILTDAQGWSTFSIVLPPSENQSLSIKIQLQLAGAGTWAESDYRTHPSVEHCLELRILGEPSLNPSEETVP